MSNYTISDSIFKLLFEAVKVAVHNMRVRHAKRRLEKAFDKAIKLSENPNSTAGNLFRINGVYYFRTSSEKQQI